MSILRALHLRSVARRHIGEVISTNGPDGVLVHAGWLGMTIQTPDGDHTSVPWSEIRSITTGGSLVEAMERAKKRAGSLMDALRGNVQSDRPALSPEEIARVLAGGER